MRGSLEESNRQFAGNQRGNQRGLRKTQESPATGHQQRESVPRDEVGRVFPGAAIAEIHVDLYKAEIGGMFFALRGLAKCRRRRF